MGIYNSNCDFNKYKLFYAVADAKSFSKAAEVLHISQPAISYAIKELEETLKTKLFIRQRNGVKLTDDGEKLMFYTQKALNNLVIAQKIITEREDEANGLVRIGIYSHISLIMLPKIIKEFNSKYPNAKFSIYQSSNYDLKEKLKHRELDFIIMQYPIFLSDTGYTEEIVAELDTCFFATRELYLKYKDNGINMNDGGDSDSDDSNVNDDIESGTDINANDDVDSGIDNNKEKYNINKNNNHDEYPLILPFTGYADIDSLEEKLKRNEVKFKVQFRSYASETAVMLVKENLGIGWGIKNLIKNELENHELYEIPLNFDSPKTIYSIAYSKQFLNNTTKEFLDFFKDNIDKVINDC